MDGKRWFRGNSLQCLQETLREQTLKEITNRATKYNEKVALKAGFPGAALDLGVSNPLDVGVPYFQNREILDHL